MARVTLTRPGEDVFVGGDDIEVIGTRTGGEEITIVRGNVRIDASASAGGDIIYLPGFAQEYTAQQQGSTVIFSRTTATTTLQIPVGISGNEIVFSGGDGTADDDPRTLVIDVSDGRIELAGEAISTVPQLISPPEGAGAELLLTTGQDTLIGGSEDESFLAVNQELGSSDHLDGREGIDTLFHGLTASAETLAFSGFRLESIESLIVADLSEGGLTGPLSYDFATSDAGFGLEQVVVLDGTADTAFKNIPTLAGLYLEQFGRLGAKDLELTFADSALASASSSFDIFIEESFVDTFSLGGSSGQLAQAGIETINFITGEGSTVIFSLQSAVSVVSIFSDFVDSDLLILSLPSSVNVVENNGVGSADIHLNNASGAVRMIGGVGADVFSGGMWDDVITTHDGNDSVSDNDGEDLVNTGAGDDQVYNGAGSDIIITGEGADQVIDGPGDDEYDLGSGNDRLTIGEGRNIINCGTGDDIIDDFLAFTGVGFDAGDLNGQPLNVVDFGAGRDMLIVSREVLDMQFKNITSGSLEELQVQFSSPNRVELGREAEEAGIDTVDVSRSSRSTASLDASAFERALTIHGGHYSEVISGAGDDIIFTRGYSRLTGGEGADTFRYDFAGNGRLDEPSDTITDFESGSDRVDVRFIQRFGATDGKVINLLGNYTGLADASAALSASAGDGFADAVFADGPDLLLIDLNDNGLIDAMDLRINLIGVDGIVGRDIFDGASIDESLASQFGENGPQSVSFEDVSAVGHGAVPNLVARAELALFQDLHVA